jgi:hypothetical protein
MIEGLKVCGRFGEGFAAFGTAFFGLKIDPRVDYNCRSLGIERIRGRHKKHRQYRPYSKGFKRESTR